MKISIRNFKAIRELNDYEIKPMNILSGANSTGKTSFIQLLLLIKQSLEEGGRDMPLVLQSKNFLDLGNFEGIINKSQKEKFISFSLQLDKYIDYFESYNNFTNLAKVIYKKHGIKDKINVENIKIYLSFSKNKDEIVYIKNLKLTIYMNVDKNITISIEHKKYKDNLYHEVVVTGSRLEKNAYITTLNFTSMLNFYAIYGERAFSFLREKIFENFLSFELKFKKILSYIYYIGPLRQEPQANYPEIESILTIGKKGENAIQTWGRNSNKNILYYTFDETNYNFNEKETTNTLNDAINYWMCKIFKTSKNIKILSKKSKSQTFYIVEVENFNGNITSITHVGFGISQLLPIVIQGLLLEEDDIFILEQPEIHLHPKIQSLLFDFLYSLTLKGVRIIVETHSDHFINRMLRRVAEDPTDTLAEKMNLTFMDPSNQNGDSLFHPLHISEYGSLDVWPKDFFDQYDEDSREIVKAQAAKRRAHLQKEKKEDTPVNPA